MKITAGHVLRDNVNPKFVSVMTNVFDNVLKQSSKTGILIGTYEVGALRNELYLPKFTMLNQGNKRAPTV